MQGLYEVYCTTVDKRITRSGTTLIFSIGAQWSYVENVAYAHLLAADKLVDPGPK